jgi:saccharopine dehydrogenase (NAD+, L-lysine-forming)
LVRPCIFADSMNTIRKIGILREGKVPPDLRVALTPEQCSKVQEEFGVKIIVQPSPLRVFTDDEYRSAGLELSEDLTSCDLIIGVKEVPKDLLIPHKTYLFFSHTIKQQPHNQALMREIIHRKIELIDYEVIRDTRGKRLIGFGRYAGIVGAFEGLRAYGLKAGRYSLPSPASCRDRVHMESYFHRISLPDTMKIVLTGNGRVGHGAMDIMKTLNLKEVAPEEFMRGDFNQPVFTHLDSQHYFVHKERGDFQKQEFYKEPGAYKSILHQFVGQADLLLACHLWAAGNPVLLDRDCFKSLSWRCRTIADISCDINGPIASTIRSSTISEPFYGYHRELHQESDPMHPESIMVMAIDNLPCELPRDASEDFGDELIRHVMPHFFNGDKDRILYNATETTAEGKLTPQFAHLSEYAGLGLL